MGVRTRRRRAHFQGRLASGTAPRPRLHFRPTLSWQEFRERANVWLYDSKDQALGLFQWLNLAVNLSALVSLAIYYGYDHSAETAGQLFGVVKFSFGFYVLHYLVRVLYHFHPKTFFRETWAEGLLMALLAVEGAGDLFLGMPLLGSAVSTMLPNATDLSTFVVQGYLLVAILTEWMRPGSRLPSVKVHPAMVFIMSFLVLIAAGTWLLSMPQMTTVEGGMPWADALFTATSATCVTGLMSVDTMTYFTHKGHWVLLVLIQLGGLNFIAFGSFLALASKFGVAVKQHDVIEDFVNTDNLLGSSGTLSKVVMWCLGLELLGAVALMALWSPDVPFSGWADRAFSSVFHSVSAFNNAGITLFTDGLAHPWVATNWLVHWVITALVFLGALGMIAMFDLFDVSKLRERMMQPWKTISFPTKIALYFSTGLVVVGAVAYGALGMARHPGWDVLVWEIHHCGVPKRDAHQRLQHRRHWRGGHAHAVLADGAHVHRRLLQLDGWRHQDEHVRDRAGGRGTDSPRGRPRANLQAHHQRRASVSGLQRAALFPRRKPRRGFSVDLDRICDVERQRLHLF